MVIVCEYDFGLEDPAKPGFSLHEVDCFSRWPRRVSIRKDLVSGCFEVYEHRYDTGQDRVLYSSGLLKPVVEYADEMAWNYAGILLHDEVCDHEVTHAEDCRLFLNQVG